eukprot:c18742_g1_i2.p1 GENE.c18742_g1_i2~~c18742_g1_i2.p1  ORF type:complete len:366 (-),score=86.50 c18742_g1_i2:137-1126(-)
MLKAKLAKLRTQLMEPSKGGPKGEGFDVLKAGHARVAMVGFPSVGKSTLLSKLTSTESATAAYEFTTLTCIPGNIYYRGAEIQLLDMPGIIEGAAEGKGRGRQVISAARTADLVLMMLDASKGNVTRPLLEKELYTMGIRLNSERPNIYFKVKSDGGVQFNSTIPLTKMSEKLCRDILHEYKIFHAEVLFREDSGADGLIDVIEGNRKYLKCLYVYNKIDMISLEEMDQLAREPDSVVVSCDLGLNMDFLLAKIWQYLGLVRVHTKKRGEFPDFSTPLILRQGATVQDVCHGIHRSLVNQLKYALVWVPTPPSIQTYQNCTRGFCTSDM